MNKVLVDTTVWIDFFRNVKTPQVKLFKECIDNRFDICVCSMIKLEILQGINDDAQFRKIRKNLDNLLALPTLDSSYELGCDIYRKARSKGFTIRKSADCLIAAIAIENNVRLLHNDKDYDSIEKVTTLHIMNVIT